MTPSQIEAQIKQIDNRISSINGTIIAIKKEIESLKEELCELLQCEEGQEGEAIKTLKSEIEAQTEKFEKISDQLNEEYEAHQ